MKKIADEFAVAAQVFDMFTPALADDDPLLTAIRKRVDKGSTIVDFGVGTGRIALPLQASGYTLIGIDISPDMLTKLRAKPGAEQMRIIEGSFADRYDIAAGSASAIVCVFHSLYHTHDAELQRATLQRASEYLRPGGLMFLDNPAAHDIVRRTPERDRVTVQMIAGDRVVLSAGIVDPVRQSLLVNHVVMTAQGNRLNPFTYRYIWPSELRLMAELVGLEVIEETGDWSGTPFGTGSREHCVVLRKK